nr:MAG TPA: hypothetical protein [Caudoviricetes sp.]
MRAGGHFTALNLRINRCNEPLSYFFVKRQSSVAVFFVCRKELMIYEADIKTATLR